MSELVVAVDIDDVLRHSVYPVSDAYAVQHGLKFEHPAVMVNGVLKGMLDVFKEGTPHLDEEDIIDHIEEILCRPEIIDAEPISGAVEGIASLSEKGKLVAVSSCPAIIKNHTESWIEDWFKGRFEDVHILGGRWGRGYLIDKWQKMQEFGATHIIDDLIQNSVKAGKIGAQAVLFGQYPWNQTDELPGHVTRCDDWPATVEYFDARG
jgi:hypothetical protein